MNNSILKKKVQGDLILVVDDIADNSFLLQTILEGEGYNVEVADSGGAALARIAVNPPDLVLLDVMMPEMDGFEVTEKIRKNFALPFIPILLVTGYSELTPAAGFEAGADGFIRKPINFEDLLNKIRMILLPVGLISPQEQIG
jgi:CheY-like chemotaxis protein